ncbi:MAG: ATP-binding cassette domain-containing protein [Dehalococcoidales bacterium]|nr:ATP-binding cassette domain-containing protein [Dehalococcoidales bacterium]
MVHAVDVQALTKVYSKVRAVDDTSFIINSGEIFGLLGPNGAGKTTTIRMLLTLIKPTSGKINIFDIDALSYPEKVRQMAGYVPQDVSVDGELTGYENILMSCKLYGIPGKERKSRIKDALEYLELHDRANSMVNTYSGGMMRRLEIAQALVNQPKLLFLDEPSIGLDPIAKRSIWEHVERLRSDFGTTIIMTTHDMTEADALCDRLGIMSKGKLITIGEPSQLRASLGGDVVSITTKNAECSIKLKELGYSIISEPSNGQCDVIVSDGEKLIPHLLESLRGSGVEVDAVSLKKPTLDDVFLKYTGARIAEGEMWREANRARRTFRRLAG